METSPKETVAVDIARALITGEANLGARGKERQGRDRASGRISGEDNGGSLSLWNLRPEQQFTGIQVGYGDPVLWTLAVLRLQQKEDVLGLGIDNLENEIAATC